MLAANDYYPFGMLSRTIGASDKYRFGFNGKEYDNEVKGRQNQQDYGMRIYDPRIGRFLSVDPIGAEFPWNSAYAYAEGNPINYIDFDGLKPPQPELKILLRLQGLLLLIPPPATTVNLATTWLNLMAESGVPHLICLLKQQTYQPQQYIYRMQFLVNTFPKMHRVQV